MDRCMAAAEWSSFPERRARSERNDKLRGIGMATYTERCGGGFPETASIEFKDERIELVMGNQEYGTGLVTSYKQLVSDQLGVDADRVDVIMGDTDRTPSGLIGGSRALAVAGAALYEAGRTIIDKGTQLAAHLLEVSAQDARFADGLFSVPGTDLRLDVFAGRRRRAILRNCRQAWSRGSTRRITAYRQLRPSPTAATSPRSRSIPIPAAS